MKKGIKLLVLLLFIAVVVAVTFMAVSNRGQTNSAASSQRSGNATVQQARQAFWAKKYDDAEKHYQDIIPLDPDNADLTGEVGNFYYAQGKWEQAADSYYKCALSLLKSRRYGQAEYISKIIRGLNNGLADKLDNELNEIRKNK